MSSPLERAEQAEAKEPWAAGRDASWYNRPNVHSDKAIHMAGKPCMYGTMSRCGRSVLDDGLTWIPEHVPTGLRCQSNGCRQAWRDHPYTKGQP
ncbi:hypothetical protein ACWGCW_00700 [Streptomyces sp. NPDC054933]